MLSGDSDGLTVDSTWMDLPHPVVVADRAGTVRALSASALAVLPGAMQGTQLKDVVPAWLWQAHQEVAHHGSIAEVSGRAGERQYDARAMSLPGGEVAWWLIDDTAQSLSVSRQALLRERERAAALDEVSTALLATVNVQRCRDAAVTLAARHLSAAAAIVAPAVGGRLPVVCCAPGENRTLRREVDADPGVVAGVAEALRGFPPAPARWIDPASVPPWLLPPDFAAPVASVIVAALPGYGAPAGALVLARTAAQPPFSDADEAFARALAARAGAALSAAWLQAQESAVTSVLMRNLLPPPIRRLNGIDLAGGYRASEDHRLVGGDFYDVHPARVTDDETLVLLGDVCGKGVEAAALTGKIRNILQALAPLADDHQQVLSLLNTALISAEHTRFATLVLASLTPRDGQVAMRLTSAGHMPPLIVRNDGSVHEADTHGMLVGVVADITSTTFETVLAPGELCVLYTDGVTEARGGPAGTRMFGEDRLAQVLQGCVGMPPEAVVERIMMLTSQWVGQRAHDDIAVVAIAAPPRTHLTAVDGRTAGRYIA